MSTALARPRGAARPLRARLDWVLAAAVLALVVVGGVLIWSATHADAALVGGDPLAYARRHGVNATVGLVLATGATLADHRLVRAWAPLVYLVSLVGLLAVLTPLGSTISGARSWILLPGGFSVQPSELAKVALVVGMAMVLADVGDDVRDIDGVPASPAVVRALALAAVPLGLVMLQPDLGTAMALTALAVGVLVVSGAAVRWLVGLSALGVVVATLVLVSGVLEPYQRDRLTSFLDPGADPSGAGYNVRQVRIAIGSGGLTGQGLGEGAQTQGGFVPAQHTDFVFSVAGEELGLLGAGTILVLFAIVLWRCARVAAAAPDLFGRLVVTGVLCWFAFHVVQNVGMCLGLMPVTGIPLPFVSYGGSAMIANLLAVGLVQNVHRSVCGR